MSFVPLVPFSRSFADASLNRVLIPVYAFSLFIPTIINDLGYTAAHAQLLSTPPYVAGCICTVVVGILSDKYKVRGPFVLGCTTVGMIGYGVLYGIDLRTKKNGDVVSSLLLERHSARSCPNSFRSPLLRSATSVRSSPHAASSLLFPSCSLGPEEALVEISKEESPSP